MASREHCSASATRASNTCTAWVSRTACRLTFNDGHSDPQDLDRPHGNGHGHHWPRAVVPALRSHSPVFGSSGYAARPPCSAGRIPWPGRCRIQHSTTHRSTCRSYSMASCFSPETGRTTLRAATRSLSVVAAGGDCSPSRFRMQHESVSLHHLYHTTTGPPPSSPTAHTALTKPMPSSCGTRPRPTASPVRSRCPVHADHLTKTEAIRQLSCASLLEGVEVRRRMGKGQRRARRPSP